MDLYVLWVGRAGAEAGLRETRANAQLVLAAHTCRLAKSSKELRGGGW